MAISSEIISQRLAKNENSRVFALSTTIGNWEKQLALIKYILETDV